MSKHRRPPNNVVKMPTKGLQGGAPVRGPAGESPVVFGAAGSADDPRTQEAMQLVEAFLAIEDAEARRALITLAERLVSYDWLRTTQRR